MARRESQPETAPAWLVKKVMNKLVANHQDEIVRGRFIMKAVLYTEMSWWFRYSRQETKEMLRILAANHPGVLLRPRGIKIQRAVTAEGGSVS